MATETFNIEQRLLQHDELRLDLDVEAARGLEQAQQHAAKGNFMQRTAEKRLTAGTDCGLEFVDAGVGGCPASLDVCLRDALVVTLEKGKKVLREEVLVDISQRADNTEIKCDVAAVMGCVCGNENVAGVHVGVKKSRREKPA